MSTRASSHGTQVYMHLKLSQLVKGNSPQPNSHNSDSTPASPTQGAWGKQERGGGSVELLTNMVAILLSFLYPVWSILLMSTCRLDLIFMIETLVLMIISIDYHWLVLNFLHTHSILKLDSDNSYASLWHELKHNLFRRVALGLHKSQWCATHIFELWLSCFVH